MSRKRETPHIPEVYASRTEVGNVREHNEDSLIASSPLFIVADGMGGHEAGEVASEIAVQTIADNAPDGPDAQALAYAVVLANEAVLRGAQDGTGRPGMGTTVTAALVFDDEVTIAQVGDSRAYLLHGGALQRITRDHSLVADLIEQGRLTEEEARYHPQRSVITRALGSDAHMQPDTYHLHVEDGDRLLLCSDGLTSMLQDSAIEAVMAFHPDPQQACDALVDEALAAGGFDNVTVIVVDPFGEAEPDDGEQAPEAPQHQDTTQRKKHGKRAKKSGRKAPFIWAAVFIVLIAAACAGFYAYAQNSYYLTTDEQGYVVLYRGFSGSIAGISLSWVEEQTDIDSALLAPTTASRLERGIAADSRQEADELMESYRQSAQDAAASQQDATSDE